MNSIQADLSLKDIPDAYTLVSSLAILKSLVKSQPPSWRLFKSRSLHPWHSTIWHQHNQINQHKVPVLGKWMKYHKPNQQASHTPTCSRVGAIFNHKLTKKVQNSWKKGPLRFANKWAMKCPSHIPNKNSMEFLQPKIYQTKHQQIKGTYQVVGFDNLLYFYQIQPFINLLSFFRQTRKYSIITDREIGRTLKKLHWYWTNP